MLAAAAKLTKRTLFDDPYRTLVSNSNKSNNNNIKKTHSLCQFALETLDDNVLKRTAPWRTCHHVFPGLPENHVPLQQKKDRKRQKTSEICGNAAFVV